MLSKTCEGVRLPQGNSSLRGDCGCLLSMAGTGGGAKALDTTHLTTSRHEVGMRMGARCVSCMKRDNLCMDHSFANLTVSLYIACITEEVL